MTSMPPRDTRPTRSCQPAKHTTPPLTAVARTSSQRRAPQAATNPPQRPGDRGTPNEVRTYPRRGITEVLRTAPSLTSREAKPQDASSLQYWEQRRLQHEAALLRYGRPAARDTVVGHTGNASRSGSASSRNSEFSNRKVASRSPSPQKATVNNRPRTASHVAEKRSTTRSPAAPAPVGKNTSVTPVLGRDTPVVRATRSQLLRPPTTGRETFVAMPRYAGGKQAPSLDRDSRSGRRADSADSRASSTGGARSWCSSVSIVSPRRTAGSIPAVRSSVSCNSPHNAARSTNSSPTPYRPPKPGSLKIKAPGLTSALGRAIANSRDERSTAPPSDGVAVKRVTIGAATTAAPLSARTGSRVPPLNSQPQKLVLSPVIRTESSTQPPLRARV